MPGLSAKGANVDHIVAVRPRHDRKLYGLAIDSQCALRCVVMFWSFSLLKLSSLAAESLCHFARSNSTISFQRSSVTGLLPLIMAHRS
jgi:hypothetical protein